MRRRNDDCDAMAAPPYVEKIIAAYGRGAIVPGTVGTCIVRHDDWCNLPAGRGKCNCDPDIELKHPEWAS